MHLSIIYALMAVMFASCNKKDATVLNEVMDDEARLMQLQQKVRLLQFRLQQHPPIAGEWSALSKKEHDAREQIKLKRMNILSIKDDLKIINRDHQSLISKFIISQKQKREEAIDQKFDIFSSAARDYQHVSITTVDELGIEITHRDGKARVAAEDLTDEQINRFGLDRVRAVEARREEQLQALAFEKWVEKSIQQKRISSIQDSTAPCIASSNFRDSIVRASPIRYNSQYERPVYRVRQKGRPRYYYVYRVFSCFNSLAK